MVVFSQTGLENRFDSTGFMNDALEQARYFAGRFEILQESRCQPLRHDIRNPGISYRSRICELSYLFRSFWLSPLLRIFIWSVKTGKTSLFFRSLPLEHAWLRATLIFANLKEPPPTETLPRDIISHKRIATKQNNLCYHESFSADSSLSNHAICGIDNGVSSMDFATSDSLPAGKSKANFPPVFREELPSNPLYNLPGKSHVA